MQRALAGIIPDGALINGVANFYTSIKPTLRVDGSTLVIGDRWINPSNGNVGYWNGTYWVSPSLFTYTNPPGNLVSLAATSANTGFLSAPQQNTYDMLIQRVNYVIATSVNQSASNNWSIAFKSLTSNNTNNQYGSTYNTFTDWALQANSITSVSAIHNAVIANTTLGSCRDFRHDFTLNNSGGTLTVYQASVVYQLIYG